MRVSGAAKVHWEPPRRKMGEFLEISWYTVGIPRAKKLKLAESGPGSHAFIYVLGPVGWLRAPGLHSVGADTRGHWRTLADRSVW